MKWQLVENSAGKYFRMKIGDTVLFVTTTDGFAPLRADGFKEKPVNLHQVHSDRVFIINRYFPQEGVDGDGLITFEKGLFVAVKTADCYPIFILDKDSKVASVVHAGWRGTKAEIARKAVRLIKKLRGIEPSNLIAVFGPGISGEHYEVGEDVARFFNHGLVRKDGRIFLDLLKENIAQLEEEGIEEFVPPPGDTYSSPLFYSFRRERMIKGLMWSIIGIGGNHGKNN